MNKKNHYINLFVLACMMVLAITSCQQELMPVQPEADSARTLTFTLNMPQGKPAFGEGESRAATNGTWAGGDELLMTLTAGENQDEYMILYLTLQHNASGTWDVVAEKSYTHFTQDNSYAPYSEMPMLTQTTDLSLSGGTWTVRADEAWPENLPMSVQLVYAPDMEFDAEGGLALKADATTSLPEYWDAASTENTDGTLSLQWTEPAYARLRIYTGMAGDEVKLTSEAISAKFTRTDYTYTATTQADGYACFYCTTTGTAPLTSGFKVELTGLKGMTLPTPETLLEATPLVSVQLDYGKSYKLDAEDKRQKVVDNFIVIDGCATDVDAVKAAFRTGYAAGKRTLVVEGTKLAEYNNVVGMAIANSYVENGSLSLLMPNVASVPDVAFQHRDVLKSVSAPSATLIGNSAFDRCAFLTTAFFSAATSIGTNAFYACTSLEDISFPSVVSIGEDAFYRCNNLTNASFPVATLVGKYAFDRCTSLKSAFFPAATSIGSNAFYECTSLEDISFPAVVSIGREAFHECSSLTTASFPAAESIEQFAFYSCDDLTTASFPAATSTGEAAFQLCSSLTTVSFPVAESVGNYAFHGCSSLTSASFPCATSIGIHAFYLCYALTSASFPLARSIGEEAFYVCRKLATLSFGSVITSVGNNAFSTVGSEAGGCDLHLAEGQGGVVEGDDIQQGIWGDKQWKSITVGGVKIYPAANGN